MNPPRLPQRPVNLKARTDPVRIAEAQANAIGFASRVNGK